MFDIKQQTQNILERSDYVTCEYRGCFDIAAKKENLLLLKTLLNVDSFQREQAKNLKIISNNLDAHPFLIGMNMREGKLQYGIVYERFELPTVSLKTFEDLIFSSIFPRIYRDRGGFYVEIDSQILKETRKRKGMSQRELAEAVGINKKVIYEHEKKQLRMVLSIAERIEQILNKKIIKTVNIFKTYEEHGEPKDSIEKNVGEKLEKLGFKIDFVNKAPLDLFAKENLLMVSEIELNKRRMIKRAADLKDFIKIVNKPAILITEKTKEQEVLGIPLIESRNLEDLDSKELLKIAKKTVS